MSYTPMSYATPRTTNWNAIGHFVKTKPPIEREPINRKVEIVKRILARYTNEFKRANVILGSKKTREVLVCSGGRKWGKTTLHRAFITKQIHLLTHRYTLCELKHALATNNRAQIKRVINERINLRTSS
jgi:hypothetical protein